MDIIWELEKKEHWSREEFLRWYKFRPDGYNKDIDTKTLTFSSCEDYLYKRGLPYKDIWFNDFIIWKLQQ